jgi:hypothetical protein
LQTGIGYYKKGRYSQTKGEMEKIFKLEKEHKEARRYWNMADRAIFEAAARKEIKSIVESLRIAEQEKDLPTILFYIGPSSFKEQKRMDMMEIINNFDDIQSVVEDASIAITFKDRNNAEVKFTNFSTAISKQTRQPVKIFEGQIIWTMQKQGNVWKIVREDKRE